MFSQKIAKPPLSTCYVIEKNGKKSYLFGTFHGFYNIPSELVRIFPQLNSVLVEYDTGKDKDFRLDGRIVSEAYERKIPVISLESKQDLNLLSELNSKVKQDLLIFFSPKIYCDQIKIFPLHNRIYPDQDLQSLKKVDSGFRSQIGDELYHRLVHVRNHKWKDEILKRIEQGNALIAVGISHIIEDRGYVDILTEEGYKLKPFPVKISVNKKLIEDPNSDNRFAEQILTNIDRYTKKLQTELHSLTYAFREKKLSQEQSARLNQILVFSTGRSHYNPSDPGVLSYCTTKPLHAFMQFTENDQKRSESEEIFVRRSTQSFFLKRSSIDIEPATKLLWKQECHRLIFYCSLFYPEIAQELLNDFVKNHNAEMIKLSMICGVPFDRANSVLLKYETQYLSEKNDEEKISTPTKEKEQSPSLLDKSIKLKYMLWKLKEMPVLKDNEPPQTEPQSVGLKKLT